MVLSNKGASAGNVEVQGPFNIANSTNEGGFFSQVTNAAGLTAGLTMKFQSTNNFRITQWAAAGVASISEANLTNTTRLEGTLIYEV
jgi:hypothetical protein